MQLIVPAGGWCSSKRLSKMLKQMPASPFIESSALLVARRAPKVTLGTAVRDS